MLITYIALFSDFSPVLFGLFLFILLGSTNAANLTDGLDGLLAGLTIIALVGFFLVFLQSNQNQLALSCVVFIITLLVFLIFNKHPAKIFMGDTGSLALGAILAGYSIIANNPWLLLFFGAVLILETASVIIQVIGYKLTKKRVFLMAPLHHHFELLGLSQKNVVRLFWSVNIICLLAFIFIGPHY